MVTAAEIIARKLALFAAVGYVPHNYSVDSKQDPRWWAMIGMCYPAPTSPKEKNRQCWTDEGGRGSAEGITAGRASPFKQLTPTYGSGGSTGTLKGFASVNKENAGWLSVGDLLEQRPGRWVKAAFPVLSVFVAEGATISQFPAITDKAAWAPRAGGSRRTPRSGRAPGPPERASDPSLPDAERRRRVMDADPRDGRRGVGGLGDAGGHDQPAPGSGALMLVRIQSRRPRSLNPQWRQP